MANDFALPLLVAGGVLLVSTVACLVVLRRVRAAAERIALAEVYVQVIAVVLVAFGATFTYGQLRAAVNQVNLEARQLETDQRFQFRQRYDQALEQIESPDATAQIIGIYSLGSLAAEAAQLDRRLDYYQELDERLSRFVRERAPCRPCPVRAVPMPHAVQVALRVLGAHEHALHNADRRVDLRYTDLRAANLSGLSFARTDLRHADLRGADLTRTDLQRADLRHADLRGADLTGADLRGADLRLGKRFATNLDQVTDDEHTKY